MSGVHCPGCKRSLRADSFCTTEYHCQERIYDVREDEDDEESVHSTQSGELSNCWSAKSYKSFDSVVLDHDKLTARASRKGDSCKVVKLTGWLYKVTGKVKRYE